MGQQLGERICFDAL